MNKIAMEQYRPAIHVTPNQGWMNDPNGLVYFNGEYHLFFQYYPDDTVWGPMHWGHAVSTDLVNWTEVDPALYPDESGMCFSGSAIVDWNNDSGLFEAGKPGLLAFYTSCIPAAKSSGLPGVADTAADIQQQSLAYSHDGYTWHKYNGGAPIIANRGNPDFRDPKVIWHQGKQHWVMALACGQHIELYTSNNLVDWTLASEFGHNDGAHTQGPWECPDLFELPVEGSDQGRWVLVVGIGDGCYGGGSGTQYFIGDFDGERFVNDNSPDTVLWMDYGRDYYATQSWSDIPAADGRRLAIAWMSNWQYANQVPTEQFRSAMSLAREIYLFSSPAGIRLGQRFVHELSAQLSPRQTVVDVLKPLRSGEALTVESVAAPLLLNLTLELAMGSEVALSLFEQTGTDLRLHRSEAGIEVITERLGACGDDKYDTHYPHCYALPTVSGGRIALQVVADRSSLEVLVNDGEQSLTNLVFADSDHLRPTLSVQHGTVNLVSWHQHTFELAQGNHSVDAVNCRAA